MAVIDSAIIVSPYPVTLGEPVTRAVAELTGNAAQVALTVPEASWWRPVSITVTVQTSAAVANRRIIAQIIDGEQGVVTLIPPPIIQIANQFVEYLYIPNGTTYSSGAGGDVNASAGIGMPDLIMRVGASWEFQIEGSQVGDTFAFTDCFAYVQDYPDITAQQAQPVGVNVVPLTI